MVTVGRSGDTSRVRHPCTIEAAPLVNTHAPPVAYSPPRVARRSYLYFQHVVESRSKVPLGIARSNTSVVAGWRLEHFP